MLKNFNKLYDLIVEEIEDSEEELKKIFLNTDLFETEYYSEDHIKKYFKEEMLKSNLPRQCFPVCMYGYGHLYIFKEPVNENQFEIYIGYGVGFSKPGEKYNTKKVKDIGIFDNDNYNADEIEEKVLKYLNKGNEIAKKQLEDTMSEYKDDEIIFYEGKYDKAKATAQYLHNKKILDKIKNDFKFYDKQESNIRTTFYISATRPASYDEIVLFVVLGCYGSRIIGDKDVSVSAYPDMKYWLSSSKNVEKGETVPANVMIKVDISEMGW